VNLIINKELIDKFCEDNDFIIVTDQMLKDNNIYKDIVYATKNNFVGKAVYPKDMPLIINDGVWDKLVKINNSLNKYNLCIKIYDAYRPVEIQRLFWDFF
jgi:D-alanyl-D-alanine dipeptidase